MTFWQNFVLKWKEIQQFCLWALPSDPSGLVKSGMYYNTTANRAALRDDTKTQLLAHLEDTYRNAGVMRQPTITKGTNSITVGNDAIVRCYKTTDYSGVIQEIENPTGGTFALAQNTPIWLVYTYGVGYSLVSSIPTGPLSNVIPVFRFFNAFGVIHSSTQDELAKGATEKMLVRIANTEYFRRVGDAGVELSTSGLTAIISGGEVFNGPVDQTLADFNSSTNTLYQVSYDDGVWAQTTRTTLNNTQYNPSTGLATLNSNKYCWAYVWRSVGDDVEAFYQLGEKEYATDALAIADLGKMPANIFGLYLTHCVLVGYVLLKQGVTTTQVFSAWGRPSVAGAPVFHNTLSGIDAGDTATPYYGHVKSVDNTRLNAAGAANGFALLGADGKLPSGQLPSYVDDVLEYATKANFPATGENGKIYVDIATNLTWRWSGSTYVEISPSLALGETSATAYRGDRGKIAYDHSQTAHAPSNADNTQAALNAGTSKTTPVDADALLMLDSAASNAIKKLSWANVKATLKSYFDGLYASATDYISKTTTNSQSISSELVTKKSIYNFRTEGTRGTAGHFKICTITITKAYVDRPLEFTIAQRQRLSSAIVSLLFSGTSENDPGISSFTYFGASDHGLYAYKSAISTWEIYVTKVGNYDNLQVHGFNDPYNDFPNIVWHENIQVSAVPSGAIQATKRVLTNDTIGNAATATKLETPRTIALTGDVTGSASFDGATNASIAAVVADDSHNHIISNVDNLQSELDGKSATTHTHGNLTNDGKLGTTAGLPVVTTTSGAIDAVAWGTGNPAMNGTASPGTSTVPSRSDHVHPVDTGRAPTSHASTATTYGASSASNYGHAMASSATPAMNGTAAVGTDNAKFAREGHVHPSDTSRVAIGSGLSAGASVVVRAYNSGNTYSSNVIYLEY